ncbi:MAG: cytochrome C oxidase subunit IV family protein [Chloroflexota bacterium]
MSHLSEELLPHQGAPSSVPLPADPAGEEYGYTRVAGEHGHPNALRYVQIATILAILTAFEVTVYYMQSIRLYLVPILLTLSAVKFVLVVLFYMHLKFDSRLFSALFTLGLLIAGAILMSLLVLFRSYFFAGVTG